MSSDFIKALDNLILAFELRWLRRKTTLKFGAKKMNNNWLGYLIRALSSVPVIVAGIEQIHGDKITGATKKQMALEALGLAGAVGPIVDPVHAQAMQVATGVISQAIDGAVSVMNAANAGQTTKAIAPPAAPAAPVLPSVETGTSAHVTAAPVTDQQAGASSPAGSAASESGVF